MLTVAEMYVTGVSTRRVEKVMKSMGIESISGILFNYHYCAIFKKTAISIIFGDKESIV